ncbi:MAG: hypothetical protein ACI9LO_002214, partial [Planctomycetota bacterium]
MAGFGSGIHVLSHRDVTYAGKAAIRRSGAFFGPGKMVNL